MHKDTPPKTGYLEWSVALSPDTRAKGKRPGWGGSHGLSRQKSMALPEIN